MNTHGIDERAGDEHLLHQPHKWVRTEKEKARERKRIAEERAKARRTICRNGHNVADRALLLEAVGLIRRDEKTKRWQLT